MLQDEAVDGMGARKVLVGRCWTDKEEMDKGLCIEWGMLRLC